MIFHETSVPNCDAIRSRPGNRSPVYAAIAPERAPAWSLAAAGAPWPPVHRIFLTVRMPPGAIAAACGIPVDYLHELFHGAGYSVRETIV